MSIDFGPGDEARFPRLTDAHIGLMRDMGGREEAFVEGQVLLEEGDLSFDFLVILEGAVLVTQGEPPDRVLIVRHDAGGFVGDAHTLTQRAAVVRCEAEGDGRVLRLTAAQLQRIVVLRSALSDILIRAFLLRREAMIHGERSSTRVIGSRYSADTHRIREFLTRNGQPFRWLDIEADPQVAELLERLGVGVEQTPVVLCSANRMTLNPSNDEIAKHLGLDRISTDKVVDVVVVGAGPAGLAATVYAASEGLEVITLESGAPGGQAGTSSKIENYLGFPTGISGQNLADRALLQAQKFGAQVASARTASRMLCDQPLYRIYTQDEQEIITRSVVIATGARYRRPALSNACRFEGNGLFYGATSMEAPICRNCHVIVVGGGNSAGQAVVYLSGIASHVHLMVRGNGLEETMSRYLIRRVEDTPNVHVHLRTEITELFGDGHLEKVAFVDHASGDKDEMKVSAVFMMLGAVPNTDWICPSVSRDEKGFVLTGRDLSPEQLASAGWPGHRTPYPYESSQPRIFAVGDVRSESTKRVATSVGEGSAMISFLHRALADLL